MRATSYNNKIMKILVTGAKGFVGKNLCAQLNNIKDGKARCYGELKISDVFEYDLDSTSEQLDNWCRSFSTIRQRDRSQGFGLSLSEPLR